MPIVTLPNTRLEKACAKDGKRFILEHVHVNLDENLAVAADGFILAGVPLNGVQPLDASGSYLINRNMLEIAHQTCGEPEIELGLIASKFENVSVDHTTTKKSPDVSKIIPDLSGYKLAAVVDVEKLLHLAQAICEHKDCALKIYVNPDDFRSQIYVEPLKFDSSSFGLIMPMTAGYLEKGDTQPRNSPLG